MKHCEKMYSKEGPGTAVVSAVGDCTVCSFGQNVNLCELFSLQVCITLLPLRDQSGY